MAPTNDELDRAVKDLQKQVTLLKQFITPTGTVSPFAGSTAPSGWLLCDGSELGRVEYAALFDVIKETYGAGDSSTTFNLPDLRGRTAIGVGQGVGLSDRTIGQATGEENHTLTLDEMPQHAHTSSTAGAGSHAHTSSTAGAGSHAHTGSTAGAGSHAHSGSTTQANLFSMNFNWNQGGNQTGYSRTAASYRQAPSTNNPGGLVVNTTIDLPASSNHAHSFSTDAPGDHAHGVTIDGVGDHAHGVTIDGVGDHAHGVTIDGVGGGQLHNNMQPSLALNYIIKV